MQRTRYGLSLAALSLVAMGCKGSIGEAPGGELVPGFNRRVTVSYDVDDDFVGDSKTPISELLKDSSSVDGAPGMGGREPSAVCMGAVLQSSDAPLRRLTVEEYENTLRDLFPGVTLPKVELSKGDATAGFENAVVNQSVSPLVVEQFSSSAEQVAAAVVKQRAGWAPCADNSATCAETTLLALAERAYRRPLDDEEQATFRAFINDAMAQGAGDEAVAMGVEAILQSPSFMYRPEFGTRTAVGDDAVQLSGHEVATRLSYFLVGTLPDAELLQAAASGDLLTVGGYRAHAERLLADPRARPVLTNFFMQWLQLDRLDNLRLATDQFGAVDDALRADLKESARKYVEHALWVEDSWVALMSGSYGFVNDRLAPYFGVPKPGTDQLVYTELNPAERRGILTQPGVLAATSHDGGHSPILRGVTVLRTVLCMPPPPPPGDVAALTQDAQVSDAEVCTTRDSVFMKHTSKAECQNCHKSIDGAGMSFEKYDALGRFRTMENGCPVDASGEFPGTDIEGVLPDALALSDRLTDSMTATACFSNHLFNFALGREAREEDQCEVEQIALKLLDGRDSLQGMMLKLVISPSFLTRPKVQ